MMMWVVTGESRLTGERVRLTVPMGKDTAEELLRKAKSRQHSRSAYRRLKLQPEQNFKTQHSTLQNSKFKKL